MKARMVIHAECPICKSVMMLTHDHKTIYCATATCEHYMLEYAAPTVELMPIVPIKNISVTSNIDGLGITISADGPREAQPDEPETPPIIPARLAPLASFLTRT